MTAATDLPLILLGIAFFFAAALYASVGHGGASAYLAVMGLIGMAPAEMKPIALVLNICVSSIALGNFVRAGHFKASLFWPLALASVPAAFLGGWLQSPLPVYQWILASALVVGAWRLLVAPAESAGDLRPARLTALCGLGAGIGLVSGLVGIGGGIFLTPVLVIFRWSSAKVAAATSAAFIAVNSCSGLGGFMARGGDIPGMAWVLLPCTLLGGWLGSRWGSGHAPVPALRRALAAVLVVAAAKFVIL